MFDTYYQFSPSPQSLMGDTKHSSASARISSLMKSMNDSNPTAAINCNLDVAKWNWVTLHLICMFPVLLFCINAIKKAQTGPSRRQICRAGIVQRILTSDKHCRFTRTKSAMNTHWIQPARTRWSFEKWSREVKGKLPFYIASKPHRR